MTLLSMPSRMHASIATTKDVYIHTTIEDVERRMRELNLA